MKQEMQIVKKRRTVKEKNSMSKRRLQEGQGFYIAATILLAMGIVFAVVFVVGHALNFAINCLGAYVHTNRLQYVEFFSKFYEGGGRAFSPLGMNTKYYEFMEE